MPTGYTATLCKQEQTFSEFALGCARAFGACIDQKDDPLDDIPKVPEKSNYYEQVLAREEAALAKLKKLTAAQKKAYGIKEQKSQIRYYKKALKERKVVFNRLMQMIEQVKLWEAPTKDHIGLKEFMLEQLESTLRFDGDVAYYERALIKEETNLPITYYTEAIEDAKRAIKNAKEDIKKEEKRTNDRGQWINQLYESIGKVDPTISLLLLKKL